MKAARWYNRKDIRVEDVPEPRPKRGEVKIKVAWAGICGSDLHEYIAGPIFVPAQTVHPLTAEKAPIIMGHEFSGQVVEVGDGLEGFIPGDRVAVEPIVACGACPSCRQGKYNLCSRLGFHGLSGGGGGFAEYTTFPANFVHKLPDGMSLEEGALIEPVAVAVHAVRKGRMLEGESAIVFGAGPIGLSVIAAARAAGARKVIAVELAEKRMEYARKVGANNVVNPARANLMEEVMRLTDGRGLDIAFETAGVEASLRSAVDCIRPEGRVVIVSIWEEPVQVNPNLIVLTEKELIGTIAYRDVYPATMALMADKRIDASQFITGRIELDQIVDGGFEELIRHKDRHVKILVSPRRISETPG